MKKILYIAIAFSVFSAHGASAVYQEKLEQNKRLLKNINTLGELAPEEPSPLNSAKYDFKDVIAEIDKIEDPWEMAKLILISRLFEFPGTAGCQEIDNPFSIGGDFLNMLKFKEHKDFGQVMYFIKNHSRLDGGGALAFHKTLWEGRDNPSVKQWLGTYLKTIKEDPMPYCKKLEKIDP